MANYGPGDAESEIADAQMAMDPTRSECVRPTVLDHYNRWMRSKSMTDKFMELDGLIRACLPHMSDPHAVKDVLDLLDDPILRQDILTKNADKYIAGVPIGVLEMNECWVRYPRLADIWGIVQKDLVRSGLLPWAMTYPDKILHGRFMQQLIDKMETFGFEPEPTSRPQLPQPHEPARATPIDITERLTSLLMNDGDKKTLAIIDAEPREPRVHIPIPDFSQPPGDDDPEEGPSEKEIDAAAEIFKIRLAGRAQSVKHD